MRDYGRVHTSLWASDTLAGISDDARLLALYLLTCSHSTMGGIYRLPDGYVAEDLGWTTERFHSCLETLSDRGFIRYCQKAKWVWIVKFLVWNRPENPNQWKAIRKLFVSVPENCSWKADAVGTVLEPLDNTPVPAPAPAPVPVPKAETGNSESGDSAAILDAYHAILPKCQAVSVLGPKRKRRIAAASKQAREVCREQGWPYEATEFWTAYFTECAKDEWLRGDKANPNNPDWRQKLDTLVDETRFTQVMDRAIASMRGAQ